jgi:hypothetical protein
VQQLCAPWQMVPNDGTNKTMDTPIVDAFLFFWYRIWTLAGGGPVLPLMQQAACDSAWCMRACMHHAPRTMTCIKS